MLISLIDVFLLIHIDYPLILRHPVVSLFYNHDIAVWLDTVILGPFPAPKSSPIPNWTDIGSASLAAFNLSPIPHPTRARALVPDTQSSTYILLSLPIATTPNQDRQLLQPLPINLIKPILKRTIHIDNRNRLSAHHNRHNNLTPALRVARNVARELQHVGDQ